MLPGLVPGPDAAGVLDAVTTVDPKTALDVRIDGVQLQTVKSVLATKGAPRLHVESGRTEGIACKWSAHLTGNWKYWQTDVARDFQYVIRIDNATIATGPAILPAGTKLGSKTTDNSGWQAPTIEDPMPSYQGSSTTTNHARQYAGVTSLVQWTAEQPGRRVVRCEILGTGLKEPTVANNAKGQYLFVAVPVAQAGSAAAWAAAKAPQPFTGKLPPRPQGANRSDQKAEARVAGPTNPVASVPPPVPKPTQSRLAASAAGPNTALPTVQQPAASGAARELAALSCSIGLGGLRFSCATRAGFDRCEALRAQRRVEQCALSR